MYINWSCIIGIFFFASEAVKILFFKSSNTPFKGKTLVGAHSNDSYWAIIFISYCLFFCTRWFLVCYHSIESYWTVFSCGTVNYAAQAKLVLSFMPVYKLNVNKFNVWPFKWKKLNNQSVLWLIKIPLFLQLN